MQNEDKKVKKSFFQNMKAELKKVIWPTGKQTVKSTFVTIAFVLLISAILIVLNLFFNFLSDRWYGLILGRDTKIEQNVSGDASGESAGGTLSGEVSGEITSGDDIDETSGEIAE
jgi:preprotein translocase SecE subunit